MSDRCARIMTMLALAPVAVGLWFVLLPLADTVLPWPGAPVRSMFQIVALPCTLLWLAGAVWIWRRYVRWTVLRTLSTPALILLSIAQVFYWQPIYPVSGCGRDDEVCTAQSLAVAGIGLLLLLPLWWRGRRRSTGGTARVARLKMSANAVRLLAMIALVPLLSGLFFLALFLQRDLLGTTEETAIFFAYLLGACSLIAVSLLLWRRAVIWDRRRRVMTMILALVLVASCATVFIVTSPWSGPSWQQSLTLLCYTSPLFTAALWLAGTARLWRGRGGLSLEAGQYASGTLEPRCPECSYSLRGLREVRCPECGWSSTVDGIVERTLAEAAEVP